MGKTRLMLVRAGSAAALTAVLLAGCGDDGTPTDASTSGDEAEQAEDMPDDADDVQTIEVAVADGVATPGIDTYQVALGEQVRIEITSDVADELHMHGYDLELELEPGVPGVLEFTADIEGRFELETHESALQLLQLEVQ